MSELLSRLDLTLRTNADPVVIAEAKVRKACYLARTGYFEQAKNLIVDLRRDFGAGENGRISAWIMLAEGVLDLFERITPLAKDRIARSQLIAVAIGDRSLGAITCAWKAHMDFEASNFESMASSLSTAMELADSTNHEARARIASTISNCMFLYGDRDAAQKWFMTARDHALQDGDQATIDALLYNRAVMGAAFLRVSQCLGDVDEELLGLVQSEIASAENFQALAKILSVNHFIRLWKARLLMMRGKFQDAIEILEVIRPARPYARNNFSEAIIDLECAFCLLKIGQAEEASALLADVGEIDSEELDVDERLVIAWLQIQCYDAGMKNFDLPAVLAQFKSLRADYLIYIGRVKSAVAEVVSSPPN